MKKTLSLLAVTSAIFLSSKANAQDGVYVGADAIFSNASYKYQSTQSSSPSQSKIDGNGVGVGVTLGYKKFFNNFFTAPEIFYDYLNSSTRDYYKTSGNFKQDSLELRSRYGAKLNLGYNFTEKFSSYATYGLATVDHVDNFPSDSFSQGKWKTSAIYGLGATISFMDNWAFKAEFNTQRFNVPYSYDAGTVSKIRLNTLKTGLAYSF